NTYTYLLIVEALVGLIVALSNLIVIGILISGWKKLMKNHFYIVVANLIVFTSLKAFVEFGFILPYYVMQNESKKTSYELLIFNLSVLADYGILFFSVVIAVNRYLEI
ncbi:hypothetical protein PENTCL1PPCAC_27681, partial [Pristionchus entomophagus]